MSFVEFLMEYYFYILAVLIILVVGVIGFLVDSNNKKKKNVVTFEGANNDSSNVSAPNAGGQVNNEGVNENTNLNNVMPEMVSSPINVSTNNTGESLQSMQPQANNEVNGLLNLQPDMSSVTTPVSDDINTVVNPINNVMPMTDNMNMINNVSPVLNNNLGGVENIVPVQSIPVEPSPVQNIPVQPVNNLNNINNSMDNLMNSQMMNNNGVMNLEFMKSQVNTNVGEIPVQNINPVVGVNSMGMGQMGINNNVVPMNNVAPVTNVNSQPIMNNTLQTGMIANQNIGNVNMNHQPIQNGNIQNSTNNVVTSNGSQPFDISSMFGNNQ